MCGIVGYAGFTKRISLEKALDKIKNRGPDGTGAQYFDGIALGNTRLAIIDLSANGRQPMFNHDKSLCITFNGEIYNFKEIKTLLEGKYIFRSNSDTEVILYSYQEWGIQCLEKFQGMFAFVMYDRKKGILFGARDRLGQKPLKYYFNNGKFIFASEIKAILSLLDTNVDIDEEAIDDYLTLQYVPAPKTGFKRIFKLPAGHYFLFKNDKLTIKRYWSLDFNRKLNVSTDEWESLVFNEIKRSLKSHLVSDVPVGALLSGGLDSSIIVALMSINSSRRVNTFSIGFDDGQFDETPFVTMVSKKYKTLHTQLNITSVDLMKNIQGVADVYDEPIGDNSILPTMLVTKLASTKVKVALTGDGGDENFAGYERYAYVNLSSYISTYPSIIKYVLNINAKIAFRTHPNKLTERMDRFASSISNKFYRRYVNYNSFFTNEAKHSLYSDDFENAVRNNDTFESYRSMYDEKLSDLDNALKIDINRYLPDDLLYKTDAASMANGLELRAPFLDHVLMETIAGMPSKMKLNFTTKKKILKEVALKYKLLPKEVIHRSKQGFTIPQNRWFKGPLRKYLYDQILTSHMTGRIFDRRRLEAYLDDYYRTNLNYDNNIFALLMLSLWLDKYQS